MTSDSSSQQQQQQQQQQGRIRKRNRITLVCNVCKFRKVKCDRGQPCNSCVKYNTAHVCAYNEPYYGEPVNQKPSDLKVEESDPATTSNPPSSSTISGGDSSVDSGANFYLVTRQYSEVMRFFKDYKSVIGVNPISSPTDTINFFDYSSISSTQDKYEVNHGPFTWPSFMKKDAGLSDLWSFMSTKSQTFSDTRNKILQSMTERNDGPVSETNRRLLSNTPIQVIQRINRSTKPKIDSAKQKEANVPVGLNLIKNDDYSSNSDLPSKILAVLPTKRIIWIHVSRFFKFIYPFIPFLDEISFKKSLESIIGLEAFTEDKVSALNIVDNHDFAVLGLMLVILRMSYLSLISNNQEINDYFIGPLHQKKQRLTDSELRSLKTLLLNSIARSCMNRFQIFQKMNLTILQLSLFMRIYGPDRNQFQIYNATLFSMAEPTKFKDILNDEKENNIRRKIWLHLRYLDLHQAFAYGNPSLINPLNSDVKFPFEKDVLDSFSLLASKFMEPVCLSLKKLTNIIMDIDHPTRISELVEELGTHISEFVDAYEEESFNDSFKKVLQLPYYIHVKFFMVSMYHHLFIHYESEGKYELSFFYLKKMLLILFEEFLPNYFKLLDQEHYYFSYSANLFLNPIIETAMHKSNGILFSLIIRMNYTIRAMEKGDPTHEDKMQLDPIYKDYFDAMKKLLYYFVKCSKIGTLGITKLGRRYLYSWRISKSHVYILKSIQSDDFYSSFDFIDYCEKDVNPEAPNCGNCNYNPKKMNVLTNFKVPVELAKELVEIMSGSMSRIDRPELVKEWVALYGPIITTAPTSDKQPESTNKRRKTSEVVFPDTNVPVQSHLSPFPIEHSFDQNIDELFSRIIPSAPEIAGLNGGIQNTFDNALENYYALDDPSFGIFDDLSLDQLVESFDTD
ncbi:uncharacterized protein RJT20DRAFT_148715 [Scheffersomyces xylosifermentans]|uniref:uncharacterized protein n=1 Tax=Scheffersomyces xylosifermentans TaxID=1304137 RepID=UPI00315DFD4E